MKQSTLNLLLNITTHSSYKGLLLILTGVLFTCFNQVYAQKLLKIDLESVNDPVVPDDVNRGEYFVVQIENVNPNLYSVSLKSQDTILSKALETPGFGSFSLDGLTKLVANISPANTMVSLPQGIAEFALKYDGIQTNNLVSADAGRGESEVAERINEEKAKLNEFKDEILSLAQEVDNLKLNVYKSLLYSKKKAYTAPIVDLDAALSLVQQIRDTIENLQADVSDGSKNYIEYVSNRKSYISANPELLSSDKSVKESYVSIQKVITEAFTSISADKVNELLSMLVYISNLSNYTYTSLPIQFTGDQAVVEVFITPRKDVPNLQSKYFKLKFPAVNQSYTTIGSSFYVSDLHDEEYSSIKTPVSDSTFNYSYVSENFAKAEIGLAILLRRGVKIVEKNNVGLHYGIGAGISMTQSIKPRLLFGGGLSFGRDHMFAIDVGGIAGYVDKLSSVIEVGQAYGEKADTVTVSKLNVGIFASIGYLYSF